MQPWGSLDRCPLFPAIFELWRCNDLSGQYFKLFISLSRRVRLESVIAFFTALHGEIFLYLPYYFFMGKHGHVYFSDKTWYKVILLPRPANSISGPRDPGLSLPSRFPIHAGSDIF